MFVSANLLVLFAVVVAVAVGVVVAGRYRLLFWLRLRCGLF